MAYVVVQRHVKRSLNMFTLSELLHDCSFSFVLCNMDFFSRCLRNTSEEMLVAYAARLFVSIDGIIVLWRS